MFKISISKNNDRLTVIISKNTKKELEKVAKANNRSISNYVVNLIEEDLDSKIRTIKINKIKD